MKNYLLLPLVFAVTLAYGALNKIEIPFLSGPVVDEAKLLSDADRAEVEKLVETLNRSGKIQMAILIPSSLQGNDIETYSIAVAESWKLGKKGADQGFIFVLAPNERKMRFEIGYGLEGDIPDAVSKRIQVQVVSPYFKAGRYKDGIMMGVEAIAQRVGVDVSAPVADRLPQQRTNGGAGTMIFGFFILFIFFLLSNLGRRNRYGGFYGGWGGGGFGGGGGWSGGGGGGFGGGGGGFGGGGSSSDW